VIGTLGAASGPRETARADELMSLQWLRIENARCIEQAELELMRAAT
jgi:hypothetical protein